MLFLLLACNTAPPTFEDYAEAWAEAQCADIAECDSLDVDPDECVAARIAEVLDYYGAACEENPDLYDRKAAADCLARYAEPGCVNDAQGDASCDPAYICAQGPYAP